MKVVILCGGRGVRAFPFTEYLPKPMLPVGGTPIIAHIIKSYIAQGFKEFILAAGYRKNVLDDYFDRKALGAHIDIIDTGDAADTGERIHACRDLVGDTFLATYGDGLSDVPVSEVIAHHRRHGALATVTAVPLVSQYGVIKTDGEGLVTALLEKPRMREQWINAGFFVFSKEVFQHWTGHNLERDVLPRLVTMGRMAAYTHDGFFKSMDSYKDQQDFEELFHPVNPPWACKTSLAASA